MAMHIYIPALRLDRSGGFRVTVALANGLVGRGHRVTLAVLGEEVTPFPVSPQVAFLRFNRGSARLGLLAGMWRLARSVPRDADVVLASYYLTTYIALLAKLFRPSVRLFYLVQGYEPGYFRNRPGLPHKISYLLARLTYLLPLRQITISTWLAAVLERKGRRPAAVINNAIDLEVFFPGPNSPEPQPPIVMTVATSNPHRGFGDFSAAIRLLWERGYRDLSVSVVTQDSALRVDLPVPYTVRRPQSDTELVELYRAATVYVTCSHAEGFGLTPLEAMACGTASLTTDSGGVRDYAIDGVNCLLAPVGDLERIAVGVQRLCENRALRQQLRLGGLQTAQRMTWGKAVRHYENVFTSAGRSETCLTRA